ncbi:MAG: hypothetical protein IJY92_05205 [Alphaproteobacteria bacterium]|nr:hypothetical protein [Alphaproteobacteria bacterium]
MYKKILFSTLIVCLLVGSYSTAVQACPIIDTKNASKVFKNIFNVHTNQATANETASKEDKLQEVQTGKANCSAKPGNKKTEIKTTAWEYISKGSIPKKTAEKDTEGKEEGKDKDEGKKEEKTKVIDIISNSEFLPFTKKDASITDAKKELIKLMFFENKSAYDNAPSSEREAMQTKRKKYANEAASKGFALATALRSKVKEDAESLLASQTAGCNQVQSHALQNRNLKALIKITAANIIVKILTMENEAAVQLLNEPLVEMTEEDIRKSIKKGEEK